MLISRRHGYIYVHVYKVAGQSVKMALRKHEMRWLPGINTLAAIALESPPAYAFRPLGAHAGAAQIRDWLGPEEFARLFSFAFVRNPWDWQVSLYHFIRHNKVNYQRRMVSEMSFDEYIRWRVDEDRHLQSEYLCDRHGELLVDFVGRFEQLEADFATIATKLGLRLRLPHVNATRHDDYREHYTDETAGLVAEAFAPDIDRFGYSFE